MPAFGERPVQTFDRIGAGERHRDARLGHFFFEAVEPCGIAGAEFEKAGAFAHRRLIACRASGVAGVESQHQAVQEFPSPAGAFAEDAIHCRRQPDDLNDFRQFIRVLHGRTVQMHPPSFTPLRAEDEASTQFVAFLAVLNRCRNSPQRVACGRFADMFA